MDAPLAGVAPVVPTIFHDDETVDLDGTALFGSVTVAPAGCVASACAAVPPATAAAVIVASAVAAMTVIGLFMVFLS